MINWAICDDAEYLCKSFEWAFENVEDLKFMGSANSAATCLELIKAKCPDILLLDIQMETQTTGIELIPKVKGIRPSMKIIMLTNYDDDDYVFSAFVKGADDFVKKTLSDVEILDTIRAVYNNQSSLRADITQKIISKANEIQQQNTSLIYLINMLTKLSTSEYEVLKMSYYGQSYKQIAENRFVDVSTIRTLASRILKKFEYNSIKNLVQELQKLHIFEYLDKR